MLCAMALFVRSAMVSVAAQKNGALAIHPIGSTCGIVTGACGESNGELERIECFEPDSVVAIREVYLDEMHWPLPGVCICNLL